MRIRRHAEFIVALVAQAFLVACAPSRFAGDFNVLSRGSSARVPPGRTTTTVRCLSGEQLLGGGYTLLNTEGSDFSLIGVEADYPSSASGWTVTLNNTDTSDNDQVVVVTAYCVTTPDLPLDIAHVESPFMTVTPSQTSQVVSVSCPSGAVLTGAGYEVTPTTDGAPSFNEWLLASAPVLTAGAVTGWQLRQLPINATPSTRVHALCARQTLTQGTARSNSRNLAPPTAPRAYGPAELAQACDSSEFTTAGGYEYLGDPLIPHPLQASLSRNGLLEWHVHVWYGSQTANYNFRPCDPGTTSTCGEVAVWAVCIKAPLVRRLHITIRSPAQNASIPVAAAAAGVQPTRTVPVLFQAVATDLSGAPLSGSAITWTDNGAPLGTGSSFSASLTFPACSVVTHTIKATVRDAAGNSASDAVLVSTGQIC